MSASVTVAECAPKETPLAAVAGGAHIGVVAGLASPLSASVWRYAKWVPLESRTCMTI
jgi:hypothetical protein